MKSFRLLVYLAAASLAFGASATTHLLHSPALNRTEIVFSYAGDLWTVSRQGGIATRLTAGTGSKPKRPSRPTATPSRSPANTTATSTSSPCPSPGGMPKRITYHPDADRVVGWTPDGKRILFRSNRDSFSRYTQLFTCSPEGGLPDALPLPMACTGSLFAGRQAHGLCAARWRPVRAAAHQLRLLEALSRRRGQLSLDRESRRSEHGENSAHRFQRFQPHVDRRQDLFPLRPQRPHDAVPLRSAIEAAVTKLIKNTGRRHQSASAGPGGIVYEQFGQIHIYDLAAAKSMHGAD